MNKVLKLALGIIVVMPSAHILGDQITLPKDAFLLDKISAVIFGEEITSVVTKSDTERLSLDGAPRTLESSILERLIYTDAIKFKIIPDENAIDRYLTMVQRENNLTSADLENMFKSAGYTYKEGREQLGVMFSVNQMVDFKIKSRLIVPESQIVKYYEEHPIMQEATFKVQRAVIPVPSGTKTADFAKELEKIMKKGGALPGAQWSSSFWINESEIAADKDFILTMGVGYYSSPHIIPDGFEVFRLLEKKPERPMPLEDRYREIADMLRRPLFEQLFEDYKKGLFESASIVYF